MAIPVAIALRQDTKIPPIIGPTAGPFTPTPEPPAPASPLPVESRKLTSHGSAFAALPKLHFVDRSTVNLVLQCQYALDFTVFAVTSKGYAVGFGWTAAAVDNDRTVT